MGACCDRCRTSTLDADTLRTAGAALRIAPFSRARRFLCVQNLSTTTALWIGKTRPSGEAGGGWPGAMRVAPSYDKSIIYESTGEFYVRSDTTDPVEFVVQQEVYDAC